MLPIRCLRDSWKPTRPSRTCGCCGVIWSATVDRKQCTPTRRDVSADATARLEDGRSRREDGNADRTGVAGAGDRVDRGTFAASQGTGGAMFRDLAGSAGEGVAQGRGAELGSSQCVFRAGVPTDVEPAFCVRTGQGGEWT